MNYYIVDAFTDTLFRGNPAGICILDREIDGETMQKIASENNLSETAFVMKRGESYGLRWFTPITEIDLCGHATLGSAYVITNFVDPNAKEVTFETKSGMLTVKRTKDLYELDFPSRKPQRTDCTVQMEQAIAAHVLDAFVYHKDLLLLLEDERAVTAVSPNFGLIKKLAEHAVMVTAVGDSSDFVSRFFAPNVGILEDPVTGSAHTILTPFWAEKLGKKNMVAKQLSTRQGTLLCEDCNDRVKMSGNATVYLQGEIKL